jgi:hypothetical protein
MNDMPLASTCQVGLKLNTIIRMLAFQFDFH